ncbi:hypothetical protein AOQ84DRAFT_413235, partial [Glonium stellatum]
SLNAPTRRVQPVFNIVSPEDAHIFSSTELRDVWSAAREIEQRLAARQCLRNMRRIQPFLEGLDPSRKFNSYSKSIEVLCNGTPFLPWIWAPVKLILQLASDYISAFEKIMTAYGQIADVLPRLNRLSASFKDNTNFQQVLAIVYSDILRFHQHAYNFFRKRGWKCFFHSSWARFDMRFKNILESLAKHSDLVDREANSINIEEAKDWRTKTAQDIAKRERERQAVQLQTVMGWLKAEDFEQEDEFDRLLAGCSSGTCDWIIQNATLKPWMKRGKDNAVVWLTGKPGSGKSVLCGQIVQFMRREKQNLTLSYFCTYRSTTPQTCSYVLRYLAAQILRFSPELCYYVLDEYMSKGYTLSIQQLRSMIVSMLTRFDTVRIVIDGVDEYEEIEQKKILNEIITFAACDPSGVTRKILFSSRDEPRISRILGQKSLLSLTREHATVDTAIQLYIRQNINAIRKSISGSIGTNLLDDIEARIIQKSNGIYGRILSRISTKLGSKDKDRAVRILEWIAFSKRPMKKWELQDAISINIGSPVLTGETKLFNNFLDICKPLIEYGPNEIVSFVHFSVQEYLRSADNRDGVPFLRSIECHHDIAFSCVAYMSSSFTLIDPTLPIDERVLRVAEGLHGLFLYANEYWPAHLLTYAHEIGGLDANVANNLFAELNRLCNAYGVCKRRLSAVHGSDTFEGSGHTFDERLTYVRGHEGISLMLQELFSYQEDVTLFSQLTYKYHDIVHRILRTDQIPCLSVEKLGSFKAIYGPSAFACRLQGCPRASHGFLSQKELDEHEKSHTARCFCSESSCEYSIIGFSTKAGLKRHVRIFHQDTPEAPFENTIRRKSRLPKLKLDKSSIQDEHGLLQDFHEEVTVLNEDRHAKLHAKVTEVC